MPDISLAALLPAAPAAPATAVAPSGAQPADPNAPAPNFLAQLKSAVASLASTALPRTAAPAPTIAGEPNLPSEPMPLKADDIQAPKTDDKTAADAMPELLVALGFVSVPATFQPPVVAEPPVARHDGATPIASANVLQVAPLAPRGAPQPSPASRVAEPTASTTPLATDAAPGMQSDVAPPADNAATLPAAQQQLPVQSSTTHPSHPAAAAFAWLQPVDFSSVAAVNAPIDPATANAVRATASSTQVPAQRLDAAAPMPAPVAQTAVPTLVAQAHPSNGFGQSAQGEKDDSRDAEHGLSAVDTAQPPAPSTNLDQSAATLAAAGSQAASPTVALPGHAQPSQVVNQIAHQADLYRLPGNKGVRIQLHPEDLGGVDVTLRYSAAGGIQLHINVEHAATGHLVQSGWTELRDALATQGIHPERLVMSITAPNDASGLDFSSNGNGSNRSDQGLAGFGQGQSSGQQPSDGQGQNRRTTTSWSSLSESSPSSAESDARGAKSASSRIDYRV